MKTFKKNIYNVKYTSVLDGISLKNEKWTSKIKKFIIENKIIFIAIIVFFTCVGMNLFLIYNFLKVLQSI